MSSALTIGRVARAAGVNVETVRFYERKGLVEQPRSPEHGFRRYDHGVVDRIRFIKRAQELGFTLAEVDELLSLQDVGSCGDVRPVAEEKLAQVRAKLRDLHRVRRALEEYLVACEGTAPDASCPILDSLAGR